MRTHPRYLTPEVERDLKRKMVFVAGHRQVGKTTLARSLSGAREGYLNWDVAEHRERISSWSRPSGATRTSPKVCAGGRRDYLTPDGIPVFPALTLLAQLA